MKKKKLKKLLRETLAKLAKASKPIQQNTRTPSPEILVLLQKVKRQFEELQKPVELQRRDFSCWQPTIQEYRGMDRTLSMMQVDSRLRSKLSP